VVCWFILTIEVKFEGQGHRSMLTAGDVGLRLWLGCRIDAEFGAKLVELECGLMPNVMAALPNIGGALCEGP